MVETLSVWNPHMSGYPMEPITDNEYFKGAKTREPKHPKRAKRVIFKGDNGLHILAWFCGRLKLFGTPYMSEYLME